jgi:hypothetical protein
MTLSKCKKYLNSFQIDVNVVSSMTDDELKQLGITQFGDRIALRAFSEKESEKKSTTQLLERVRSKLEKKSTKKSSENKAYQSWQTLQGNKNAKKLKRRVEIGWLMKEGDSVKQIRLKSGGGTRHLSFSNEDTVEDVRKTAEDVFFPSGHSFFYGNIQQFNVSVTNFDTQKLKENLTISNLYHTSHVKILRLYLFTEARSGVSEDLSLLCEESKLSNEKRKSNPDYSNKSGQSCKPIEEDELPDIEYQNPQPSTSTLDYCNKSGQSCKLIEEDELPDILYQGTQPSTSTIDENDLPDLAVYQSKKNTNSNPEFSSSSQPSTSTPIQENFLCADTCNQPFPDLMLFKNIPKTLLTEDVDEEILLHVTDEEKRMQQSLLDTFNETLPNEFVVLKLHRGHVLKELEDFFMNQQFDMRRQTLQIKMILPNGETEIAEDSGGVLRDCLSEYWNSFYTNRTTGNQLKVPVLLHTVNGSRWSAVGKIIAIGYYFEKYYPSQLASCFLEYSVNGDTIPENILLSQYMEYLPHSERAVVQSALDNFETADQDDLMDFLEDHKVLLRPTRDNIKKIITDTAHKELIQCPTYVADCWREELKKLKPFLPKPFLEMSDFKPDFKNVWKTLSWPTEISNKDVMVFMKKYIKEQSEEQLKKFLRFCTGRNINFYKFSFIDIFNQLI